MEEISRKEAIKRTAAVLGLTISGSLVTSLLKGCVSERQGDWTPEVLDQKQLNVAADFAEVLIPRTDTPGAKDAKVERFLDQLIAGYLSEEESVFVLQKLHSMADDGFHQLNFEEQNSYIQNMIDSDGENRPFFRAFKQMVLLGFFTSEIGATQVLNYDEIPGIYEGCISLKEAGGRTWAL